MRGTTNEVVNANKNGQQSTLPTQYLKKDQNGQALEPIPCNFCNSGILTNSCMQAP